MIPTSAALSDRPIFVVDDDADVANLVADVLRDAGHVAEISSESRHAFERFTQLRPALVILDLMMPSVDGITLCLRIREVSDVPILILSAKKDPPDQVIALRLGADDYVAKPFHTEELVARVEALLRRAHYLGGAAARDRQVRFGSFVIDLAGMRALSDDRPVPLTPTEFRLLCTFAMEPGRVLTRTELLATLEKHGLPQDERAVAMHVTRLRRRLRDADVNEVDIETRPGFGYVLTSRVRTATGGQIDVSESAMPDAAATTQSPNPRP